MRMFYTLAVQCFSNIYLSIHIAFLGEVWRLQMDLYRNLWDRTILHVQIELQQRILGLQDQMHTPKYIKKEVDIYYWRVLDK